MSEGCVHPFVIQHFTIATLHPSWACSQLLHLITPSWCCQRFIRFIHFNLQRSVRLFLRARFSMEQLFKYFLMGLSSVKSLMPQTMPEEANFSQISVKLSFTSLFQPNIVFMVVGFLLGRRSTPASSCPHDIEPPSLPVVRLVPCMQLAFIDV